MSGRGAAMLLAALLLALPPDFAQAQATPQRSWKSMSFRKEGAAPKRPPTEACRGARVRAEIASSDLGEAAGKLQACALTAGNESCSAAFEQLHRAFEAHEESAIDVSAACR